MHGRGFAHRRQTVPRLLPARTGHASLVILLDILHPAQVWECA